MQTNAMVPLKSIVLLERAQENRMERISFVQAFRCCRSLMVLSGNGRSSACFLTIDAYFPIFHYTMRFAESTAIFNGH